MKVRMQALHACLRLLWAVLLIALFLLSAQPASA